MAKINLTAKKVEALLKQPPAKYRDSEVTGLLLVVNSPTSASWTLRYEFNGKERWAGIGGVKDVTLAQAREKAREMRAQLVLDKVDPLAVRQAEKDKAKADALRAMTFKQAGESYLRDHSSEWKDGRQLAQWEASLRDYVYPLIGSLPIQAIDTPLVLKVLKQEVAATARYPGGTLWLDRRETASRIRGRIESILGWATVSGYRSGDNPARWGGHLEEALPGKVKSQGGAPVAQEHHAALPWAEVPAFIASLRTITSVAARALEFTILTAARSGEVLGATWDEIDLEAGVWIIPGSRMKAGKEHKVPLSPAAIALLKSLYIEQGNPFVFVGSRGGALGHEAMRTVLREMGKDVTVHGFRSAFRDWAGERTNFAHDICEAALAHVRGDKSVQAYARGDLFVKRTKLMSAWAGYLASPVKATGDVVSIKRKAS